MLTDFQNYFTTEKWTKFPTNPAIFHHVSDMLPHYLGEVKSSNLLQSATQINLKIVSHLAKMKLQSCYAVQKDSVRLAHYNICSKCPPFAATQQRRRRRRCLTALLITHWSRQWRPKAPPATQNASQKSLGDKDMEVKGGHVTRPPSPPVLMFQFLKSSWRSLLLDARFLAWNSPNTVWRPGSARTR